MKEYKKKCLRCHKRDYFVGDHCPKCVLELADEEYLDGGAVYQVQEEMDRKVTGEYAEANEGDDDLSDQVSVVEQ